MSLRARSIFAICIAVLCAAPLAAQTKTDTGVPDRYSSAVVYGLKTPLDLGPLRKELQFRGRRVLAADQRVVSFLIAATWDTATVTSAGSICIQSAGLLDSLAQVDRLDTQAQEVLALLKRLYPTISSESDLAAWTNRMWYGTSANTYKCAEFYSGAYNKSSFPSDLAVVAKVPDITVRAARAGTWAEHDYPGINIDGKDIWSWGLALDYLKPDRIGKVWRDDEKICFVRKEIGDCFQYGEHELKFILYPLGTTPAHFEIGLIALPKDEGNFELSISSEQANYSERVQSRSSKTLDKIAADWPDLKDRAPSTPPQPIEFDKSFTGDPTNMKSALVICLPSLDPGPFRAELERSSWSVTASDQASVTFNPPDSSDTGKLTSTGVLCIMSAEPLTSPKVLDRLDTEIDKALERLRKINGLITDDQVKTAKANRQYFSDPPNTYKWLEFSTSPSWDTAVTTPPEFEALLRVPAFKTTAARAIASSRKRGMPSFSLDGKPFIKGVFAPNPPQHTEVLDATARLTYGVHSLAWESWGLVKDGGTTFTFSFFVDPPSEWELQAAFRGWSITGHSSEPMGAIYRKWPAGSASAEPAPTEQVIAPPPSEPKTVQLPKNRTLDDIQKAIAANPDSAADYADLALHWENNNDLTRYADAAAKALCLDPQRFADESAIYTKLGAVVQRRGDLLAPIVRLVSIISGKVVAIEDKSSLSTRDDSLAIEVVDDTVPSKIELYVGELPFPRSAWTLQDRHAALIKLKSPWIDKSVVGPKVTVQIKATDRANKKGSQKLTLRIVQ